MLALLTSFGYSRGMVTLLKTRRLADLPDRVRESLMAGLVAAGLVVLAAAILAASLVAAMMRHA